MDLFDLLALFSIPDVIAILVHICRGLWWLIKGVVTLLGMGVRAAGRGCAWLVARVRDRERRRDFPSATVVAGSVAGEHHGGLRVRR
jgi:hypothetical protein